MKVLYISSYADLLGANHSLVGLIKHLMAMGVEPVVLLPHYGRIVPRLQEMGVKYYVVRYHLFKSSTHLHHRRFRFVKQMFYNFIVAFPKLYLRLRKEHITLVHSNTSVCDVGLFLSMMLGCKHLWHLREFGYEDYELNCPFKAYERYVYNHPGTTFIAISQAIGNHFARLIAHNPIHLVYNGIDSPAEQYIATHDGPSTAFCCVGEMIPAKNQMQIVEAAHILHDEFGESNFTVTFVGNDHREYAARLKQKIEDYHLSHIFNFTGYSSNVSEIYRTQDVGIMPSCSEAFGRVTIEYMLHNLAVIASNRGANVELIADNATGYLYDIDHTHALARIMQRCINNRDAMLQVARQGRAMAQQRYTAWQNAVAVYDIMCKILNINHI